MAAKGKKALGRGLEALISDQPVSVSREASSATPVAEKTDPSQAVLYIDINDIKPNENQPRKVFNEEKIQDLAASIVEHGVIQPLIIRGAAHGFEIVAGERRWRAARAAGLKEVPCLIRELSDEENMLVAIIENMQREDLNPIEEAQGLDRMLKSYGLTQEQVSKSVGKSRPYITNSLRLLKLPAEIQEKVSEGEITTGHARALVAIDSRKLQQELCLRIIEKGLTVREIERIASGEKNHPTKKKTKTAKSHEVAAIEEELKERLGTRINIRQKGRKGLIEIEYYTTDELNRLIDLLKTVETEH